MTIHLWRFDRIVNKSSHFILTSLNRARGKNRIEPWLSFAILC